MEERPYGKTGEKFPILSFGAQHIADSRWLSETDAVKLINYAIDHGIRYFDTAWWYGWCRLYAEKQFLMHSPPKLSYWQIRIGKILIA